MAKAGSGSLLQFCQDVVKLAAQAGEPWFFDIAPTGSDLNFGLRFTLYRYQRGVDLTGQDPQRGSAITLTMSREAGDLSKLEYNVDYSGEVNFVWRLTGTPPAGLRDARTRSGYLRYPLARRETYGGPDAPLAPIQRYDRPIGGPAESSSSSTNRKFISSRPAALSAVVNFKQLAGPP
jgi:hypothetical protein